MAKTEYRILSLDAALDVLEAFLEAAGRPLGVTEISRRTGHNKNRVFRILATLAARGYVLQEPETQEYYLGRGSLLLGEAARNRFDLREAARPYLRELAESSGDAAVLLLPFGDSTVTVDIEYGWQRLQSGGPIGETFPLHVGSSGKLLLAHMPHVERQELLDRLPLDPLGPNSITDRDELLRELQRVRDQGYATSQEEIEPGLISVGAPIRDSSGQVIAAFTLSVPKARYDEAYERRCADLLLRAARQLSAELGYGGDQARRVPAAEGQELGSSSS
jgi:DNA-binding IclR family transcriptional regulator